MSKDGCNLWPGIRQIYLLLHTHFLSANQSYVISNLCEGRSKVASRSGNGTTCIRNWILSRYRFAFYLSPIWSIMTFIDSRYRYCLTFGAKKRFPGGHNLLEQRTASVAGFLQRRQLCMVNTEQRFVINIHGSFTRCACVPCNYYTSEFNNNNQVFLNSTITTN